MKQHRFLNTIIKAATCMLVLLWATSPAYSQNAVEQDAKEANKPAVNSAMDAETFYKVLLGELNLLDSEPKIAFALILDSARKTKEPVLFERAITMALQSRSGDAALAVTRAWLQAIPTSVEAASYLVQITLNMNRLELPAGKADIATALAVAKVAFAKNPNSAEAAQLAITLMGAKEPAAEQLVKQYLANLAKMPPSKENSENSANQVRAYVLLANMAKSNKQYQQAYDSLTKAIEQSQQADKADLQYEQAMLAEKLGRLADMERILREVMLQKPNDPQAFNALGYSFAERNMRLREAKVLIQKAVKLAPEDPFIADSLGWVEYRLGNLAEAQRILEAAFKAKPDAEIAAHLGEVLWKQGNKDKATALWQEGLKINRNNDTLLETLQRFGVKP